MGLLKFLVIFIACIFPGVTWAYTPFLSSEGKSIRWKNDARFNLAGYPNNNSGVSASNLFAAVVKGLQRWNAASQGAIGFDYWQGTDLNVFERAVEYDGLSSLHFESNGTDGSRLGPAIIGMTQVWYKPESGEILEADIVFNDLDFEFSLDPVDTTGPSYFVNRGVPGRPRVFLENVLTHELGHAVGLSHSGVMQATMLPIEASDQASLDCDDQAASRTIYGVGKGAKLRGRIVGPSGAAVFGAHVSAISLSRGSVFAGAITNPDGSFQIDGLEGGAYAISAEPYLSDAASLSTFFQSMNTSICGGRKFARTFLTESAASDLVVLSLAGGQVADVGSVSVSCSPTAPADTAELTFRAGQSALVDQLSMGSSREYVFRHAGGRVEFSVIAFGLFSPMNTRLSLFTEARSPVSVTSLDDRFSTPSGYRNYDASLSTAALPAGRYRLRLDASFLTSASMPAGHLGAESTHFFVISGRQGGPPSESSRCLMSDAFPEYRSPGGNPPRADVDTNGGLGFCGRIEQVDTRFERKMGPPGARLGAIAGWFLPWAFMLVVVRVLRERASRRTVRA